MQRIRLTYQPIPPAKPFHKSNARFKVVCAGTRGGKTYSTAREFLKRIYLDRYYKQGQLHYWVVTPTYPLGKVTKRILKDAIKEWGLPVKKDLTASRNELLMLPNILIEFKSADNPEGLVAAGLDGMWIDETARIKPIAWHDALRERLSDKRGWCLFSTTPLGENWFYTEIWQRAIDPQVKDYEGFQWRTVDNTALPYLQEEVQRARLEMPLKYFRRNYEASFENFYGQIYDEFNENVHIIKENIPIDRFDTIIAGVDWGFAHAGVIVIIGVQFGGHREKETYFVIEEVVETGQNVNWWARKAVELVRKYPPLKLFLADPSEPGYINVFNLAFANNNMPDVLCYPADNDVHSGIQDVAILMHVNPLTGKPRFFVHRDCRETIRALKTYHWKTKKDGVQTEEPDKVNDDPCDAVRYAIRTFYRRQEIIIPEETEVVGSFI